ncbi:MAG: glycerol kinase [Oscillospiraceae bacterium]
MMSKYIVAVDQSTSGTKAVLFDENAEILGRSDLPHRQKISDEGWISHDPMEIYRNVLSVVKNLVAETGISPEELAAVGLSNQRETAVVWDRVTGVPVCDAVVWQCVRGAEICEGLAESAELVKEKTGIPLSPYFSAAKIAWILGNIPELHREGLCAGTIDSWLLFQLSGRKTFKTDYSNACRTQLFNISTLAWDAELCDLFGIPLSILPEVCDSDSLFAYTDFAGLLSKAIPIYGVLGDSHAALFGQGCLEKGMTKATYGTGSSVMMNIGEHPIFSQEGLATSLAWGMQGKITYVLEGNINYTGSVIQWLCKDVGLMENAKEAGALAKTADAEDSTYLVPAFTGLGAPYFKSDAKALLSGMTRRTGRAEIIKAGEESIAYQIADIVTLISKESGTSLTELRVDGGPTRDDFLMQFQSDILNIPVAVPENEELSAMGVAYTAGIAGGIYQSGELNQSKKQFYMPKMCEQERQKRINGWKNAINMLIKEKST